jgi:hypothetical protein
MEIRLPIGEVLRGLDISALPEGWMPVDAICIVKCLNAEGEPLWALRLTDGINQAEMLGTMVIQTELWKATMLSDWADE